MRIPRHLRDRSLLEDEPFASQFLIRSTASSSRSRSGGFALGPWTESIIEALKQDGVVAVQAWLSAAFSACPQEDVTVRERPKHVALAGDDIQVFIRFYWALYESSDTTDKDQPAQLLLMKERSFRGYYYPPEELIDAQLLQTQPEQQDSHVPRPKKQPKRSRRSYKRPRKSHVEDAYDAEPSEGEDERSSISEDDVTDALKRLPQDICGAQAPGFLGPCETVQPANFDRSRMVERKTEDRVVLGDKRKALSDGTSSPMQSSMSDNDGAVVPPLQSQDLTTTMQIEQEAPSSLSELTDSEPEMPIMMDSTAPPVDDVPHVAEPSNCRPRRAASNMHRLSALAKDMNKYDDQRRRGFFDGACAGDASDVDSFGPPPPQFGKRTSLPPPQLARRSTPLPKLPKHRKQKSRMKSSGAKSSTTPLEEATAPPEASADSVDDKLPDVTSTPASDPAASSPTVPAKAGGKTAKKPEKYAKKGPRRGPADDLPSRPEKRPRDEDTLVAANAEAGFIAVFTLDQPVLLGEETKAANESTVDGREKENSMPMAVDAAGPPAASSRSSTNPPLAPSYAGQPVLLTGKLPKRSRTAFEDPAPSVTQHRVSNDSGREVLPLPKRGKKRRAATEPPKPSCPRLPRQPSCLADVDSVVREAASNALVESEAQHPKTALVDWVAANDRDGQDVPPDSSDEETPLKELVTSKKQSGGDVEASLASLVPIEEAGRAEADIPQLRPELAAPRPASPPLMQAEPYDPPAQPAWPKPRLHVKPAIWAESRQEVCEAFEWFRSYQGGVYFLKDMVKGYLLSGFPASRDLFARDGRLIVSHGGGKAESIHTQKGVHKSHQASDQLEGDKSVRALLNTHVMQRPLVLLVDDKYGLFPFDLAADGYTYVVLGFYRIAHAWAEEQPATNAQGSVVRYKFAFQWCEEQGTPWWMARSSMPPVVPSAHYTIDADEEDNISSSPTSDPCAPVDMCASVRYDMPDTNAPDPYDMAPREDFGYVDEGPLRLICSACNHSSPLIYAEQWMCLHRTCSRFWRNAQGNAPTTLTYAKSFINPISFMPEDLEDLRPSPPVAEAEDGITTSSMFCKGWHCRRCGRLSCRYMWEHWYCKHCGERYRVSGRVRGPKDFWSQKGPDSFTNHVVAPDSGIISLPMRICKLGDHWGQCHTYILPHNRGRIHLICAPRTEKQSADRAFRDYQVQATDGELLFRRWPLRAHKCRGTLLTNYFSQNSGEPYQYVGGTDNTVPWDRAPSAVRDALDIIRIRMTEALNMNANFNEVLSAAYMEKQKMAFHSDAERGLGPVIASLSLGSGAYMYFRLLGRYTEKRGQGGDRNALTLYLRHGDIVVMEGADVQTFYEHTVVPVNFRIAATARSIDNRNH